MRKIYKSSRTTLAVILVLLSILGFGRELYGIQIRDHELYAAQNNTVKTYTVPLQASRGEIVDRNGNPLVTNRQGNSIVLDAAYFPSAQEDEERNAIIYALILLFRQNGEEYVHNLPLKLNSDGSAAFFTEEDSDTYETDIENMKSRDMLNLQPYATAQNCFDAMVEKYGLEEDLQNLGAETVLEIGSVRYELTRLMFSVSNPVTIAEDVSDDTVAYIKENHEAYRGADVRVVAYREYADSSLAPHVIGTVRKINAEEYNTLKDEGYGITDDIGESGIEAAMEPYLRGIPGEKTVTIDGEGNVTETVTKEPSQGDTVVLTIDKDLQALAQRELEATCNSVSEDSTGAVVVEDCNNGEVLAAASYPTFDLMEYYNDYAALAERDNTPMYNRFALGTYAPGSTFKPMMAAAALQEGVVTEETMFDCGGVYNYIDMKFNCLDEHGGENVRTALRDSCNIYFYNCANRLGISKMNMYGAMFGLGEKTGVEIPEASGILAGPEYRKKRNMTWRPGDTIQAGIGQSDNLFTPLQLANYCAAIANGGTRYQMHFVKSHISSATSIAEETGVNVVKTVDVSEKNMKAVKEGMRMVSTEGGPSKIFADLETPVASKTGTSQVVVNGIKHNNGFIIAFAPYDNPEISVASAIELAGSGSSTAVITASVIDYYYSHNTDVKTAQQEGVLLD